MMAYLLTCLLLVSAVIAPCLASPAHVQRRAITVSNSSTLVVEASTSRSPPYPIPANQSTTRPGIAVPSEAETSSSIKGMGSTSSTFLGLGTDNMTAYSTTLTSSVNSSRVINTSEVTTSFSKSSSSRLGIIWLYRSRHRFAAGNVDRTFLGISLISCEESTIPRTGT